MIRGLDYLPRPLPAPIELGPPVVELGPPGVELGPPPFCQPWEFAALLQPGGVSQVRFAPSFDRPGGRSDPPHFVSGTLANPGGSGEVVEAVGVVEVVEVV
jgi:hypothetical protein